MSIPRPPPPLLPAETLRAPPPFPPVALCSAELALATAPLGFFQVEAARDFGGDFGDLVASLVGLRSAMESPLRFLNAGGAEESAVELAKVEVSGAVEVEGGGGGGAGVGSLEAPRMLIVCGGAGAGAALDAAAAPLMLRIVAGGGGGAGLPFVEGAPAPEPESADIAALRTSRAGETRAGGREERKNETHERRRGRSKHSRGEIDQRFDGTGRGLERRQGRGDYGKWYTRSARQRSALLLFPLVYHSNSLRRV